MVAVVAHHIVVIGQLCASSGKEACRVYAARGFVLEPFVAVFHF